MSAPTTEKEARDLLGLIVADIEALFESFDPRDQVNRISVELTAKGPRVTVGSSAKGAEEIPDRHGMGTQSVWDDAGNGIIFGGRVAGGT